jgi:hypothetical protein
MIKENPKIDFYTSGRQLSESDFLRISEWIKSKQRAGRRLRKTRRVKSNSPNRSIAKSGA